MLGYKVKTKYMQAAQVKELESFVTHLVKQPAYESQKRCRHLHKKKYSGRALKRNVKETREKVNLDSRVSLARGRENKVKAKGWATEREEKHAGWVGQPGQPSLHDFDGASGEPASSGREAGTHQVWQIGTHTFVKIEQLTLGKNHHQRSCECL